MKHVILTLLLTVFTAFLGCFEGHCQIINTFAGNGSYSFFNGVAATATGLNLPTSVAVDGFGNVFIDDGNNFRVRKVNSMGIISTIAGTGTVGYSGDGGPATAANLNYPRDIAFDGSGNMYIADNVNNVIRKVNTAGIISTFAGTGTAGYTGDGGAATSAELYNPMGVAIDGSGNVYIGDHFNHVVRKVNGSGIISTFAGNGINGYSGDGGPATAAELGLPVGITFDATGNLYIGDGYDGALRKVNTSGVISTFAGNGTYGSSGDGGPATLAAVSPADVAVDHWGNVYFADDNFGRIRKVNTSGFISTYAGTGAYDYCCDGGPATVAKLAGPYGVAVDAIGRVYIADTYNGRVRAVSRPPLLFTGGSPESLTICENTSSHSINSLLTVSDTSVGLGETYSVTTLPTHGFVAAGTTVTSGMTVSPTGWAYTPMTGYSGYDTFGVTVNNGYQYSTTTIYVTINPLPNAGVITGSLNVCPAATTTLTDVPAGGVWTSATTGTAIVGSTGVVTGVAVGTTLISYTVTNSCGTVAATAIVTVNPSPNAGTINGILNVCTTTTTALSDSAGGGVWTSATTGTATIGSTGIVTGVAAGTSLISYRVTNSCGMVAATATITVNPSPNAGTITGILNVCSGATTTLSDGVGGGVWSSATTGTATIGSTGIVTGVAAGTSLISYRVTNSCGTVAATAIVTVNPLPNAGTITGAASACVSAKVSLADTVAGGLWSSVSQGIAAVGSTGVVSCIGAGIDTVQYSMSNGCGMAIVSHVITVNPLPVAGSIAGDTTLCVGDSLVMSDSVAGGIWSIDNATAIINGSVIVTGISAGVDVLSYSVSNNCGTAAATRSITIEPLPSGLTISRNDHILSVSEGFSSYQWILNGKPIPDATQNTYSFRSTGAYAVIVDNSLGCSFTCPVLNITDCSVSDILVFPNPAQSFVFLNWCNPVTARLSAMNGKLISIVNNSTQVDLSDLPNAIYILTLFDANGQKLLTKRITKLSN